jgi:GNAT superfamily N-acetyltransferase
MNDGIIRLWRAEDLSAVLQLAHATGWNQTAEDLAMLLRLAPDGCFALELDGRIAATASLLIHGPHLAWVGMVLTAEEYRRRGFARRLVERTLELADARGIRTVKLDGTSMGRPLYLDVGFRDEQPIERWSGHLGLQRPGKDTLPEHTALLNELVARSEVFAIAGAYALVRPGARARYLGPFVADNPDMAFELARQAFRAGGNELFFCDVLPENTSAVRLMEQLQFRRVRSLVRMVRGADLRDREDRIYAICGFELK